MVDTISNTQLDDLNSKPNAGKSLRDIIGHRIEFCFYYPPGSEHYKIFCLEKFHGPSHIKDNHRKNNETKFAIFV